MTENEKAAEALREWVANPVGDPPKVRMATRVTLRKFEGDKLVDTVVIEDPDFKGASNASH